MNIPYNSALIFTQRTNLYQYMLANEDKCCEMYGVRPQDGITPEYERRSEKMMAHYTKTKDIQLVLLVRREAGRTYCKIKCPINPLPIKGEFEVVSLRQMILFLKREGWTLTQDIPMSLLK